MDVAILILATTVPDVVQREPYCGHVAIPYVESNTLKPSALPFLLLYVVGVQNTLASPFGHPADTFVTKEQDGEPI
jgi:hypothetical protein